jgi:hypothetical protein
MIMAFRARDRGRASSDSCADAKWRLYEQESCVARNDYRDTINAFTDAVFEWQGENKDQMTGAMAVACFGCRPRPVLA